MDETSSNTSSEPQNAEVSKTTPKDSTKPKSAKAAPVPLDPNSVSIPLARVKRIIKADMDVDKTSSEAVVLITKATVSSSLCYYYEYLVHFLQPYHKIPNMDFCLTCYFMIL
jgi:hypothetical protein